MFEIPARLCYTCNVVVPAPQDDGLLFDVSIELTALAPHPCRRNIFF